MRTTGLLTLSLLALLTGCAGTVSTQAPTTPTEPDPVTYQPGELNRESVFELLAAEIAGQRHQFDQALEFYLHQARTTGDADVAERATRIAQFLRDSDAVLQAAELWSRAAPDNPEPLHIRTNILISEQRFDEALPLLKQVLADDNTEAVLLIGSKSAELPPQTATVYEQLLAEYSRAEPERLDLLLTRALLKRRIGDQDGALELLEQGLAVEPAQSELVLQKAEILRRRGQANEALKAVEAALDETPDHKQLRIQRAQLLFDLNKPKSATEEIRALLEEHPDDSQLQYYFALLLLDNNRLPQSHGLILDLLEGNPDNDTLQFYLGLIEEKMGDTQSALQRYLQVSNGPNLQQARARALNLMNDPGLKDEVDSLIDRAIEETPEQRVDLTLMHAEWLQAHGYTQPALQRINAALDANPDHVGLLYSRALLIEPSDPQQMLSDLERALTLEPDNGMLLNALGYSLTLYTKDYERAHTLISEALEQHPEDAAVLDSMGWVLFKLGRTNEALDFLMRAYERFADPEVAAHLVEVLWVDGQTERARSVLRDTLAQNPDAEQLHEVQSRLGIDL